MTEHLTPEEIHHIHAEVVESDEETEPGTRNPGAVEFATEYIFEGMYGQVPETIHQKAAHLLRLIAANHPYVDGNKRTALTAAAALYDLNGYALTPDDGLRDILKRLATDESDVNIEEIETYLREHVEPKQ